MSRENFLVRLTAMDNTPEFVMVHNIFRMREMPATKEESKHTLVTATDGFTVKVQETVVEIEKKAAAYGTLKVM